MKLYADNIMNVFQVDPEGGIGLNFSFFDLEGYLHDPRVSSAVNKNKLIFYYLNIRTDLINIITTVDRYMWMRLMKNESRLNESEFGKYIAMDTCTVHLEIRSIFDYIANIINLIEADGQLPSSFEKLYNDVTSESSKYSSKLGTDTVKLLVSCSWYKTIRMVRDSLIHYGDIISVWFQSSRVFIQPNALVMSEDTSIPECYFFTETLIDFECYLGYYIGRLILVLDVLTEIIYDRLRIFTPISGSLSYHDPILNEIKKWINYAIKAEAGEKEYYIGDQLYDPTAQAVCHFL
jgi:hypothetical protein